jgi:hypothetical protein
MAPLIKIRLRCSARWSQLCTVCAQRVADHLGSQRQANTYRGSKRRLQQLRGRDSWSTTMTWLVLWLVFLLFVVLPFMARNYGAFK